MTQQDVHVIRAYTHKGIVVLVELDFIKKTITLLERNEKFDTSEYKPKKWVFAEREVKYMDGWLLILEAMEHAVKAAKKEMAEFETKETEKFAKVLIAMNERRLKD